MKQCQANGGERFGLARVRHKKQSFPEAMSKHAPKERGSVQWAQRSASASGLAMEAWRGVFTVNWAILANHHTRSQAPVCEREDIEAPLHRLRIF